MLTALEPKLGWNPVEDQRRRLQTNAGRRNVRCLDNQVDRTEDNETRLESVASQSCHTLVINERVIDYKLHCVTDCIMHLSRELQQLSNCYDNIKKSHAEIENDTNQRRSEVQLVRQTRRIRDVVKIYSILLRLSPIEANLKNDPTMSKVFGRRCDFCPLDARQQVLNLIENRLPGYCDSIDLLRCILRSDCMIGAIAAFSVIVDNILAYNSAQLHENLEVMHSSNSENGSQREFRIVQEWKV